MNGSGFAMPRAVFVLLLVLVGLNSLGSEALAQTKYLPDAALVPVIANTDPLSGVLGLPPLKPPPPRGFDQESAWNMKVVGSADDLGCGDSDQLWVEHQGGRYIAYVGSATGKAYNPLTRQTEACGAQIYDVTQPAHALFLAQIPGDSSGKSGMPHIFVCAGDTLPNGQKGHYYLLAHRGDAAKGEGEQDIWDVTDPSAPVFRTKVVGGLSSYHRSWWECDTGVAYLVSGAKADGWRQQQHVYIYDLADPSKPAFIRQFGLVGGQPGARPAPDQNCANKPGPDCFEGVADPGRANSATFHLSPNVPLAEVVPSLVHQCYSTSTGVMTATGMKSEVICSYGALVNGVTQILDRTKLLDGCKPSFNPAASPDCATAPTQADLLYPQLGYLAAPPYIGAHDDTPIFNMPIPEATANFPASPLGTQLGPQHWDIAVHTSEAGPACGVFNMTDHNAALIDITDPRTPWPISTLSVPQFPGNFCQKGGRFGDHFYSWHIYAPYYGKLACITWFNAGLRCFDIRDPLNPRLVAYYIQAPNANTTESCGVPGDPKLCRKVAAMDVVDVDDRGYIYGVDRFGSGMTILSPTGAALDVVQ